MAKSVKVHDDTHRALKRLKANRRYKSIDAVVRELVREATGVPVSRESETGKNAQLPSFTKG